MSGGTADWLAEVQGDMAYWRLGPEGHRRYLRRLAGYYGREADRCERLADRSSRLASRWRVATIVLASLSLLLAVWP